MSNVAMNGVDPGRKKLSFGFLKPYWLDLIIAAIGAGIAYRLFGRSGVLTYLVLVALEIAFSFDNAVLNAKVLKRLDPFWRKVFMTFGMLVAVAGMRYLFPTALVSVTGKMSFTKALGLPFSNPDQFKALMDAAQPQIGMLGGIFLLLLVLEFLFDERDVMWCPPIERRLARIGKLDYLAPIIGGAVVFAIYWAKHDSSLLVYGMISVFAFMILSAIKKAFESEDEDNEGAVAALATGKLAFRIFCYLEAQDASMSFDSVGGGLTVTRVIPILMLGLGIGALFIRTMTVQLLKTGVLDSQSENNLIYLEHGAYGAIGSLAFLTLLKRFTDVVPDTFNGLVGVAFLGVAIYASRRHLKKKAAELEAERSLQAAFASMSRGPVVSDGNKGTGTNGADDGDAEFADVATE